MKIKVITHNTLAKLLQKVLSAVLIQVKSKMGGNKQAILHYDSDRES